MICSLIVCLTINALKIQNFFFEKIKLNNYDIFQVLLCDSQLIDKEGPVHESHTLVPKTTKSKMCW